MKGVQCYELFGGIALDNHTYFFFLQLFVVTYDKYTGVPSSAKEYPKILGNIMKLRRSQYLNSVL